MIVLDKLLTSVFLFDEEDQRGHGGLRGLNVSRFEVLLNERIELLRLSGREGIDLTSTAHVVKYYTI